MRVKYGFKILSRCTTGLSMYLHLSMLVQRVLSTVFLSQNARTPESKSFIIYTVF